MLDFDESSAGWKTRKMIENEIDQFIPHSEHTI